MSLVLIISNCPRLDCNVCISPEDLIFAPEWRFMKNVSQLASVLVDEDDHQSISAYTFALHFFNIQKYHQGLYYCKLPSDLDAPYILHVVHTELEPIRNVGYLFSLNVDKFWFY